MTGKKSETIRSLLNHPEVQKSISSESDEMIARRKYRPSVCEVFNSASTRLEAIDRYRFNLHQEASDQLPRIIHNKVQRICRQDASDSAEMARYQRQRNIGIVFSGGPAPGGHNVIAGLYDAARRANPNSQVFGFLNGPDGIIENEYILLTDETVNAYRNLGGFTMIKTGRTKIDSEKKVELSRETCLKLGLDALVIVGGDDSNTNAAFLAEKLYEDGVQVIGVPKTIDGDLQVRTADNEVLCAISFGFHTAARRFAQNISDLATDSSSDVKYWHVCRVMGRVASHLALEVALQTHPNVTLIGEDLADYEDQQKIKKAEIDGKIDYSAYGMTLRHLSRVICNAIVRRAAVGKNYGLMVIPEGTLEFINEIQVFIIKLNTIIAEYNSLHDTDFHTNFPTLNEKLDYLRALARRSREDNIFSIWNTRDDDLFNEIPAFFQEGLLTERDNHGNFQFSQVETDKIIMGLVRDYLDILREEGVYKIGVQKDYYRKYLESKGLAPERLGPVLFRNYEEDASFLLVKKDIISLKTLKQALERSDLVNADEDIPAAIKHIYNKSVPKFKTQIHFYGYDGRGGDPTKFDCNYTYNLGLTTFSLIAGGATGQMAAIRNLEHNFENWEPIGIPIAPLMHLEERKGKLALVLEKNLVDTQANAFRIVEAVREKWLAATPDGDDYRRPGPVRFGEEGTEDMPLTLALNAIGTRPY
jgi:pyrophosphate--fructose-6-phosphate 1-phosphotransferase